MYKEKIAYAIVITITIVVPTIIAATFIAAYYDWATNGPVTKARLEWIKTHPDKPYWMRYKKIVGGL